MIRRLFDAGVFGRCWYGSAQPWLAAARLDRTFIPSCSSASVANTAEINPLFFQKSLSFSFSLCHCLSLLFPPASHLLIFLLLFFAPSSAALCICPCRLTVWLQSAVGLGRRWLVKADSRPSSSSATPHHPCCPFTQGPAQSVFTQVWRRTETEDRVPSF